MDVALLTQASASGRSELSIHTGSDGALTLALRRDGVPLLQAAALRGVRVARPASAPEHSGPAAVALALADGAGIHVERHVTLDLFTVSVKGADGSDAVEVGFALEEVGPCYGIGHLMRQHWPLQQGALELGPFYVRSSSAPFSSSTSGIPFALLLTCRIVVIDLRSLSTTDQTASARWHCQLSLESLASQCPATSSERGACILV
jgi:hypothetical protein